MPKEYIEREAVVEKSTYMFDEVLGYCKCVLVEDVEKIPSANVVEVKHGEWVKVADLCGVEVLKCLVCGVEHPRNATAFCCDCGAKMDGKDK